MDSLLALDIFTFIIAPILNNNKTGGKIKCLNNKMTTSILFNNII